MVKKIAKYQEIMEDILQQALTGKILVGDRLSSERKLAQHYQVNRSTITHALDELTAQGFLLRKIGSGSYLNKIPSSAQLPVWRNFPTNSFHQLLPNLVKKLPEDSLDGYTGELPLDLIPRIPLPKFNWQDFLQAEDHQARGYLPLRQLLAENNQTKADEILITSGAQQGIFLILQVLLKPLEKVAVLAPSFFWNLPIFTAAQIQKVAVPFHQGKIDYEVFAEKIQRHHLKMLFINPTFQNPTGYTMSVTARRELIAFAKKQQLLIVEDDAFAKLYFPETPMLPTLHELAPEYVLHLGSLSKILGTTTKIGWLLGPEKIIQQLSFARQQLDFSLSIFPQVFATVALSHLEFPQQLRQLQEKIQQRGQALYLAQQESRLGQAQKPTGGFYLWLTDLPAEINEELLEKMRQQGIMAAPGFLFAGPNNSLRINFTRIPAKLAPIFFQKLQACF